jgi:hypothetical protein
MDHANNKRIDKCAGKLCRHTTSTHVLLRHTIKYFSHTRGHAVEGVGLRPLAGWHCGFESRLGHGCLFLVRDECCEVEVSATDPSL